MCSLESAIAYWDTGEAQVVPWIFGIMHPTGFPVFTMLAGAFAHLVPFGEPSWRIALFSAIAMSGTAFFVARTVDEFCGHPWIAAASAWLFAFGDVAWTRGTRPEVHALAIFFIAATLYSAIRWYRRGEPRVLIAGAFAWGLGLGTHPIAAMIAPAVLLLVLARIRVTAPKLIACAALAILPGLLTYAYLPIRSAMVTAQQLDPTARLGLPPGQSFWDNEHPASWSGFRQIISGADFGAGGTFPKLFEKETYSGGGMKYAQSAYAEFTAGGLLLAVAGLVMMLFAEPVVGVALFLALAVPTDFSFAYTIEADPERYYLTSFVVIAILAGYAAARAARTAISLRIGAFIAVAGIAGVLVYTNRSTFGQRNDTGASDMIRSVVARTPDNAILLAPWLDATPLAYAAYVQHRLGHRILHSTWLSDDAKYVPRWTKTRPVYVVDQLWGSVEGYRTVTIAGSPALYHVVKK